ncbi:hypothetical protein KUCAC02_036130, partial [Chaenocephalus aceratus]
MGGGRDGGMSRCPKRPFWNIKKGNGGGEKDLGSPDTEGFRSSQGQQVLSGPTGPLKANRSSGAIRSSQGHQVLSGPTGPLRANRSSQDHHCIVLYCDGSTSRHPERQLNEKEEVELVSGG